MNKQYEEPLEELAWLAWKAAALSCRDEHGCFDYHRAWSMVRFFSGNANQLTGREFFTDQIARVASIQQNLRILISGGADAAVTWVVLNACRQAGVSAQILFVDRCETPCLQNRRLAEISGGAIEVIQADIRTLSVEPVDVVIAHNFLPFFDEQGREEVLQSWHTNCSDRGYLLLSNSLTNSSTGWIQTLDQDAVERRAQSLQNAVVQAGLRHDFAHHLASAAKALWAAKTFQDPVMTEESLSSLLKKFGFKTLTLTHQDAGAPSRAMAGIHQMRAHRTRAEVCAIRQDVTPPQSVR